MISNLVRLLIFLLLVNIIVGFYITSNDNRRFYPSLKQRSAENDNEYVWFTRNIPDDMNSEEIKQEQQNLIHSKNFKKMFDRKYPSIENTMHETQ